MDLISSGQEREREERRERCHQQDGRGNLQATDRNTPPTRINLHHCKHCKAAFPEKALRKGEDDDSGRDSGDESELGEAGEFCSKFCERQWERPRPEGAPKESAGGREEDGTGRKEGGSGGGAGEPSRSDVDGGYAWIILAVMFIINASTYGTARAYGLIFEKIVREEAKSRTMAALPFNVMGALENLGGPMTGCLLARSSWRVTVFVGSCLITGAHLLAAFSADSALQQVLSMGLMCGVGLSLVSISAFNINNAYFHKYRSRAFGFCLTGAAVGTFYISPACEYVLDQYSVSHCYLLLAFILFPNVPLALLLKPMKPAASDVKDVIDFGWSEGQLEQCGVEGARTSKEPSGEPVQENRKRARMRDSLGLARSVKLVISTPMFHLIWLTQLLFCWLNFVFGMIIVDFGKDRGLDDDQATDLILVWAFGQLFGRLGLGSLVDIKLVSYRTFTVICFLFIGASTWCLDKLSLAEYQYQTICSTVFTLSMFIALLYILFNGLTVEYMDKSLSSFTVGISSFIGSFLLFPRANVIGYYRDTMGNYDDMLTLFELVSLGAALVWLLVPCLLARLWRLPLKELEREAQQSVVITVERCSASD